MPKKKQLYLPNGNRCSEPKVIPSNWESKSAKVDTIWSINYWFYDASYDFKTNPKARIQRQIKGMNHCAILSQKQTVTRQLLQNEITLLTKEGFNPILGKCIKPIINEHEIDPSTPFISALWMAFKKLKGVPGTLIDIKSTIKGVEEVAMLLSYHLIPISSITKKHITIILEKCSETRERWSPKRHNMYRAWLMKLFKYLSKVEAVTHNPVMETDKMIETKKIRQVLTTEERKKINEHLKNTHYQFWRLVMIFDCSGARETEIMQVRTTEVDLKKQGYKCLIRKGRRYEWKWRPISKSVLHLWEEILNECQPGQYLFSKLLKPGDVAIRPDQLGRYWTRHVKKKLEITADIYSLKHSYSSKIAAEFSDEDAARQNGHTSTAMVVNIYDVNREGRQFERLKNVENSFVR